jgi:hypothetical protein
MPSPDFKWLNKHLRGRQLPLPSPLNALAVPTDCERQIPGPAKRRPWIFWFHGSPNRAWPPDEFAASYWNSFIALLMV